MKYLVINGSPHKGNTWKVVKSALVNIKKLDSDCTFQEIHLLDLKLPFCLGCSNCFRIGGEFCPHKDVMTYIIDKINWADGVIVLSTTFNRRETALLKNFLDHLNYLLHRPLWFTKKALVITTVGGVGGNSTIKSISGTLRGMGFNRCYGLSICSLSWNYYQIRRKDQKKIDKISSVFCKDVQSGKLHYPSTDVLIPYNLFRGMAGNYVKGAEYETKDGEYYSDEYRKKHVYDKSIPLLPHQRVIGSIFYLIGKIGSKYMVVTYKK